MLIFVAMETKLKSASPADYSNAEQCKVWRLSAAAM